MQEDPDPNLPKLTSVDAYRHAAFSAIESNKEDLQLDIYLSIYSKYMNATGTDFYNNKVGRKFSATKSDFK